MPIGGHGLGSAPVAVANVHGGMSVFFQANDGRTIMLRQNAENELPGQGWTGWQDLGTGGAGQPIALIGASGGVVLFIRTASGRLPHKWQREASAFSAWEEVLWQDELN